MPTGQLAVGFGPSARETERAARAVLDTDPHLETSYTGERRTEIRDRSGAALRAMLRIGFDSFEVKPRAPRRFDPTERAGRLRQIFG